MQHTQKGGAKGKEKKKTPQMVKRKEMGSFAVVSQRSCLWLRPTFCWEASHRPRSRSKSFGGSSCQYQKKIWSLKVTLRGHHTHPFACRGGSGHPRRHGDCSVDARSLGGFRGWPAALTAMWLWAQSPASGGPGFPQQHKRAPQTLRAVKDLLKAWARPT